MIVALSDDERFRPKVMPSYKHNRKGRKPIVYAPLRQHVHETMKTYQRPGLEGDDVLGILATHPTLVEGEKVIVAIDKDLKQIPGWHYNYGRREDSYIGEAEAEWFFFMQCLTGDSTDGYPGCPGIGPKTAEKILAPFYDVDPDDADCSVLAADKAWQAVVKEYEKKGLGLEVALMNARVARILRHTDYDFKNKEVRLWQPNSE